MQTINSFSQRLPLHRNWIAEFNRRVFVSARAPNFAVRNEAAPNFSSVHQWAMVFDRDIRQRDALFDLGSLADIRQVQIVLRGSDSAKSDNGETKNKRLKRDCFHSCGGYPSQIFDTPLPDNSQISELSTNPPDSVFNLKSRSQRTVSLSQWKKHKNCRGRGFCHSERSRGIPRSVPQSAKPRDVLDLRSDMTKSDGCAALLDFVRRNLELVAVGIAEINRVRDFVILEFKFDSALL